VRSGSMARMDAIAIAFAAAFQAALPVPQLRSDGPEISREGARKMTPSALGDALLAPNHPPIVEAIVHPSGMEAAPPPGYSGYRVSLVAAAKWEPSLRMCSKAIYDVNLEVAPRSQRPSSSAGPRPTQITGVTEYRLPDAGGGNDEHCEAKVVDFFSISSGRELEVAQLLAEAHRRAGAPGPLPFPVTVEDTMADDMERFRREHPELVRRPSPLKRVSDPRAALTSLPVKTIGSVDLTNSDFPFKPGDLAGDQGHSLQGATFVVGEEWVVGLALSGDHIERVRVVRRIPPPF
jgi:hypothetical protein